MRRLVITCITATLLAGCGMDQSSDPLQVTDNLTAATPAASPATTAPAGTVRRAPPVQHTAFDRDTRTLVLAAGNQLILTGPDGTRRTVQLPAAPASLRTAPATALVALPEADQITRVDLRTATATPTPVPGGPVDAVDLPDGRTAVITQRSRTVSVLDGDRPTTSSEPFTGPARLLPAAGEINVLDRLTTSITPVDPTNGSKGAGLRAGRGATNAALDRFGRILTIDTRGQSLLAFSTGPLVLKQRYPVPGAPYGLAYDPSTDLAWVTLTATNEVVAYDVAGGQPREVRRLPTISQPNSITVDPNTSTVYIASANGAGYQVVNP
ncbi:YncE family protein [Saccharopolyspora griseoalba]|uniref:YncE family protein n=1 Tax=Saccharopolyspora griseoalba TaxID=1431848 RepID=A0ABW2LGW9_9PSEU